MAEPRNIWTFRGGLHLDDHKAVSTGRTIEPASIPERLVLPLQQHIGQAAEVLVKPGDPVGKGQLIARASDYVSASIHAPTSGKIVAVEQRPVAHPSGLSDHCIIMDSDGEDTWGELPPAWPDYTERSAAELRERIRWAGVVGLGGAVFPTAVKVNTSGQRAIDTLIINGAECEPYISCDDALMRAHPEDILDGIAILRHIIGAHECLIGIEDNKPEAIEALRHAIETRGERDIEVVVVPTLYPSGGEKQLIKLLTGREVPTNSLPASVGVLCQNVATAVTVANAVLHGRPLIERIVTVTGQGIRQPGNYRALIGTSADRLVAKAGGYSEHIHQLIFGGPMMGFSLRSDQVPITKATNCLLAASQAEAPNNDPERPCIRCGECARVCPVQLLPQQMLWHTRAHDFDKVQDFHLFECIECGCCAYVCPSHIPLVQYYRFAKTAIWTQEREREKSDLARRRHEARQTRLERIEAERKARLRKKKEALEKKPAAQDDDPKKAAIEAAMQRVAAKKAAQQNPEPAGKD